MAQSRILDYKAPEATSLLNSKFAKLLPVGVYQGYDIAPGTNEFLNIDPGILLTGEGVLVEEDATKVNEVQVPLGLTKTYNIVCRHTHTYPTQQATYLAIDETLPFNPQDTLLAKVDVDAADTVATQFVITLVTKIDLENVATVTVVNEAALPQGLIPNREWQTSADFIDVLNVSIDGTPVQSFTIEASNRIAIVGDDVDEVNETVYVTYRKLDPNTL